MLLGSMTVAGGPLMGLPLRAHLDTVAAGHLSLIQHPSHSNARAAEGLARGRQILPGKPAIIGVQPSGHNSLPEAGSTHVILS